MKNEVPYLPLVEELEKLLAKAKLGHCKGIAVIAEFRNDYYRNIYVSENGFCPYATMMRANVLLREIDEENVFSEWEMDFDKMEEASANYLYERKLKNMHRAEMDEKIKSLPEWQQKEWKENEKAFEEHIQRLLPELMGDNYES